VLIAEIERMHRINTKIPQNYANMVLKQDLSTALADKKTTGWPQTTLIGDTLAEHLCEFLFFFFKDIIEINHIANSNSIFTLSVFRHDEHQTNGRFFVQKLFVKTFTKESWVYIISMIIIVMKEYLRERQTFFI
jgi:hypothetical protein